MPSKIVGRTQESSAIAVHRAGDVVSLVGRVVDNAPHAHHAMQVIWARGTPARLHTAVERTGGGLVVDSGVRHALHLNEGAVVLLEPESRGARAIRERWLSDDPVAVIERAPVEGPTDPEAMLEALVAMGDGAARATDARVERVLSWLGELERGGRWPEVSLAGALALVHLSEGRFRHLFAEHVGSSWRGYLVWRRALVAASVALRGATLTEAAHAAGYADSAHLSRQFKALFGFTPSSAVGFSRFVQG